MLTRLRYMLLYEGVKATAFRVFAWTANYVRAKLYLEEKLVWYELALVNEEAPVPLPPKLTLIQASVSDAPLLHQLPTTVSQGAVRWRMETGADLWLVLDGQQPVFASWIFHDSVPSWVAPDGRLKFPPEIVCLEKSVASPSYRGRGLIAPAAWSQLANRLEKTGVKSIITKCEEENKRMRWILLKAGFREIAKTHVRRMGPHKLTVVQVETTATGRWLAKQLQH